MHRWHLSAERNLLVSANAAGKPSSSEKPVFSAPLQVLVDEHKLIKRWLMLIPSLVKNIDLTSTMERQVIEHGIYFIEGLEQQVT